VAAAGLHAENSGAAAELALPAEANGPHIPGNFGGLSYEVEQLKDPAFFSAANTGLIARLREVAAHGVLRLGGNTSEFAWWKPTPESAEPEHPQTPVVVGEPAPQYYPVSAEAVRNLDGFLQETGWSCIYGINLGTNTPERAAAEAAFAAKTLGKRLEYFQVGNEVDLFGRHLRDAATWNPTTYLEQWLKFARAITGAVPGARFGMPDIAGRMDWLTEIAAAWPSVKDKPEVVALTHHYYFGGPATNPAVNVPALLSRAAMERVQAMANTATAAAKAMGVPVRMTEGNTCYRGGKPGVSDVFAAALWAADYALLLASNGYTGVNLHGGSGPSVANSVGGSLPGDALLRDQGATAEEIASHPHPFYTPIATFGSEYVLEPVAHGLQFGELLAGGTMLEGDLTAKVQATGVDATAYAARMPDGELRLVVLNKGADRDLAVTVDTGQRQGMAQTRTLRAPSLESREATIAPSAAVRLSHGRCSLTVPKSSGLCLMFR